MQSSNSKGPVCRVTKFNPSAPWRKHGTWRQERAPERDALDALARVTRTTYRGVVVRRASIAP